MAVFFPVILSLGGVGAAAVWPDAADASATAEPRGAAGTAFAASVCTGSSTAVASLAAGVPTSVSSTCCLSTTGLMSIESQPAAGVVRIAARPSPRSTLTVICPPASGFTGSVIVAASETATTESKRSSK